MNNEQRNILRREILAARDRLSRQERQEKSSVIASRLVMQPEIIGAITLFLYMHFRSEVQTKELIRLLLAQGKITAIPLTLPDRSRLEAVTITDPEDQIVEGYYGIPEPKKTLAETNRCDPNRIDVVLVPGSVFDRRGGRLGYGGGYYDRFLYNEATRAIRIGLAFELQLVETVPTEPHDMMMDFVVTEKNIYDCRRKRYA